MQHCSLVTPPKGVAEAQPSRRTWWRRSGCQPVLCRVIQSHSHHSFEAKKDQWFAQRCLGVQQHIHEPKSVSQSSNSGRVAQRGTKYWKLKGTDVSQ